jgi:vancomycin resistance protein YoaR
MKDKVVQYINFGVIGIILVLFIIAAFVSYFVYRQNKLSNRIYPNIYIDNINVGEKTKEEAKALFKSKDNGLDKVNVYVFYKDQAVATMSADQLDLHSNASEIIDRAYDIGRTPHLTSRVYQKFATIFHLTSYKFTSGVAYDKSAVTELINTVSDQYNIPAKNALFTFENGKVTTFKPDESGLKIESDKFLTEFDNDMNSLKNKAVDKKITIKDHVVEADTKLSEANNLGIEELIGEGQSDYHHSDENRIHNLTLAATKFNGVIIPKGETFSFNKTLGDVSTLTGYYPGYVILNGKTVLGDGGGVCQVSTTMFRAVMNTGLPIVERHNHAYRVIYYENDAPPGYDATIYLPDVDLRFTNNTPAAILVQTELDTENLILHFRFYGKKDGRRVELEKPVVTKVIPAPPAIEQEDPTMARGTTKLVEHAIPGATSTFNYKVIDANNKVMFDKTFVSVYQAWAQRTLIGTKD